MDRTSLTIPVACLGRFVAVSLALFAVWPWLSRYYVEALALAASGVLDVVGQPASFAVRDDRLHVVYAAALWAEPLTLQVVQDIRIHFNLILLIALVAAAPRGRHRWRPLAWGLPLILLGHLLYLYLFSWIAIWDWVESGAALPSMSGVELSQLGERLERFLPYNTKARLERPYYYLNDFGREGLPLLSWLLGARPWDDEAEPPVRS